MLEGGRCGWGRGVASGRGTLVPEGGRHATITSCAVGEAAVRAFSVVCRAGGDRDLARATARGARDRAPARARAVHDLPRAAPQRRHAQRRFGVPGHDRARARRPLRPPSEVGQAGDQRTAAALRAGPARRSHHRPERGGGARARRAVEGPPAWGAAGPALGHGRRQDRRWATAWSPEQSAPRLRLDFPDDETMRISHEAIYQALYVQGRGALRRELTACLRTGRALRVPRARSRGRGKSGIAPEILISQRPAEAEDRAAPGHWEGDLIVGLGSSAIGTLVERTTRFTILLHLPRMAGHGDGPRTKNGPA